MHTHFKLNNTAIGISYLLAGFNLITQPGLRRFVIIPILLNIMLFSLFIMISIHWFKHALHWLDNWLPTWLHWLHWLLWPLFAITFLALFAYGFTFVALLIAAPFNGLLAEKVEALLTGHTAPSVNTLQLLSDIPRVLIREIRKILYYLPRALGLFILFFIPLIQLAAPILWFIFTAWTMAMLYIDYPMDNHRVGFHDMHQRMRRQSSLSISFGAAITLLTFIPGLNLFIMPAAVAGATKLYVEQYR